MMRALLLILVFLALPISVALASPSNGYQTTPRSSLASSDYSYNQPDLLSFGGAYMDFDKDEPKRKAADFRLEYRWGTSLLPKISPYFKSWDKYVQFHPFVGGETTTLGQLYGLGGWAMDGYIGRHVIFTWSEGVGFYYPGDAVRLGSFIEFRSQAELGWRFENEMRLTGQVSHISNAGLTTRNPGAEIAGVYLHVPVSMIFGR